MKLTWDRRLPKSVNSIENHSVDSGVLRLTLMSRKRENVTRKKTLLLILTLASSLLLSGFAVAQSSAKTEANQARHVKGQVLTSIYQPSIRVRFDKRFKYVGSQKFILYERAQVEQHFFVDADNQQRIKRMYMMQFEGYLPNINATYDYPVTKTISLGGQTYIVDAESIPNVSAAIKQNPQSDVARAASFLESKGYRVGESIMFKRFVRLLDDAKRNEFILLYVEDARAGASSETETAMQELSSRALKGFTILKIKKPFKEEYAYLAPAIDTRQAASLVGIKSQPLLLVGGNAFRLS